MPRIVGLNHEAHGGHGEHEGFMGFCVSRFTFRVSGVGMSRKWGVIRLVVGYGKNMEYRKGDKKMNAIKGKVDVAIVGGGLAGLAAACYAARGGRTVALFERSERA